ncbi:MAG: hypothetical protein OXI01_07085 [Albidovulum sp.]|nr:hypothetical protein [Albidovulum sp.]
MYLFRMAARSQSMIEAILQFRRMNSLLASITVHPTITPASKSLFGSESDFGNSKTLFI